MNNKYAIGGGILAVVLAVIACTCCICAAVVLLYFVPVREGNVEIDPVIVPPTRERRSEVGPTPQPPVTEPLPDEAQETLIALELAQVPDADLHDLAVRFLGVSPETPRIASTVSADYPVGTVRTFNVSNLDADENFTIDAVLVYKTTHVYMWVEEGLNVNENDIREAADLFESHTYPTNREFFGQEWSPGVDGDPHLSILHASNLGRTVAGYFSSADSFVQEVRVDSNEMEMFYINIGRGVRVNDDFYNGVLAHEFQHMIHWYNDRNETTWMNEGCSELAMELNDRTYPGGRGQYDVGGSEYAYLERTDTQLNTWPEVDMTGGAAPHYGASYLFMSYFLDRFGEEATKSLVAHDENGMESVDRVLAETLQLDLTHEDIFADWAVATLLDDPNVAGGIFDYSELSLVTPEYAEVYRANDYPVTVNSTVSQYGVDYIHLQGKESLRLEFAGENRVGLMDTTARSGDYMWWSNRADESNPRLSHIVDLRDAQEAAVNFWSWYHIEADWDYAYVVVGYNEDGPLPNDLSSPQMHWQILSDPDLNCTFDDPNNGNLGCGLTGLSGGWQRLQADLTPYVGQEIVLRFEYVTDAAVNQAGMALDDIEIVVDGDVVVSDDVEAGTGEWIAEGFVRHANVLPQQWVVQLVTLGDDPTVTRLLMLDDHTGTWTIPLSHETSEAVLVVSALAPVTTEVATYQYTLTPAE